MTQIESGAPLKLYSPILAGILSIIIPGLGQMYRGRLFRGLLWLAAVSLGYVVFWIPGLVLHILCVIFAMVGNPYRR